MSKRTRFEVFKRDRFTCGYCGRTPPVVVLQVDHIIPVAEGGSDERGNLLTACVDCNAGKSCVPLSSVPKSLHDGAELRREGLDQIKALRKLMREERDAENDLVKLVSDAWVTAIGGNPDEEHVAGECEAVIRQFLKRLSIFDLIEAGENMHRAKGKSAYMAARYFAGICWNMVRKKEGLA